MTKHLYDLGYNEIGDLDLLASGVIALDAWLFDIRYSPRSRNPNWRPVTLAEKLGARYVHVIELGNMAYKNGGGVVVLNDLEKGLELVMEQLEMTSVILMCSCRSRHGCHRAAIGYELANKYRFTLTPIQRNDLLRIVHQVDQLPLL